eukprot:m.378150 g.378150  ORF g.378150 m.378150 type:complete len:80 (+) comp20025_c1_seq1:1028-1267(+)
MTTERRRKSRAVSNDNLLLGRNTPLSRNQALKKRRLSYAEQDAPQQPTSEDDSARSAHSGEVVLMRADDEGAGDEGGDG